MPRFLKNKSAAIGQVPGAAIFIGEKKTDETQLSHITYSADLFKSSKLNTINELESICQDDSMTWLNINGLHDTELIKAIGDKLNLHSLTIEDILNTSQRPKMEEYDTYLYFTLKMMNYDKSIGVIKSEQISIILTDSLLVTFQEKPGDIFDPVRSRIKKDKGRIRKRGSDYLAYALLDHIIDNYLIIMGRVGESVEEIEDEILDKVNRGILSKIYSYKQELSYLRKSIRPTREFIAQLSRVDSDFVHEKTQPFLKDLVDLSTQSVEIIDVYKDMLSDHLDMYNSVVNNKLNEIMKVLTIFSVVFIPLTFLAGIYGTNFEYLPELKYRYSYFIFLGAMVVIAVGMLLIFKKKKWL